MRSYRGCGTKALSRNLKDMPPDGRSVKTAGPWTPEHIAEELGVLRASLNLGA